MTIILKPLPNCLTGCLPTGNLSILQLKAVAQGFKVLSRQLLAICCTMQKIAIAVLEIQAQCPLSVLVRYHILAYDQHWWHCHRATQAQATEHKKQGGICDVCLCVSGHLVIKECDTFTCSLSSTPLPLFQHFPVSPSAFHFLFFLHLCCSLKLEYNGSSICFQFGFPAFHFHHSLSRFYSPPFFIQCIYLLTAFAYFNLLSTTPFPWISHLHVSPFWTLSIFFSTPGHDELPFNILISSTLL